MEDILGNNDHLIYSRLFNDPFPVFPLNRNVHLQFFLNEMKQFVTKKTNFCITDDFMESFRPTIIDFIYVFSYYNEVMHLTSPYMDSIRNKIISDNPRFLNV